MVFAILYHEILLTLRCGGHEPAWAPSFFVEQLGVPMANLGRYTTLPQMAGIIVRTLIAAAEAVLLRGGVSQLALRRLATGAGGTIACISLVAMSCVSCHGAVCSELHAAHSFDTMGFTCLGDTMVCSSTPHFVDFGSMSRSRTVGSLRWWRTQEL